VRAREIDVKGSVIETNNDYAVFENEKGLPSKNKIDKKLSSLFGNLVIRTSHLFLQ
jgi:hypothetical protein